MWSRVVKSEHQIRVPDPLFIRPLAWNQAAEVKASADLLQAAQEEAQALVQSARSEAEALREQARQLGYQEGYAAGVAQAREDLKGLKEEFWNQLRGPLERLRRVDALSQLVHDELVLRLAKQLAEHLLGPALAEHPEWWAPYLAQAAAEVEGESLTLWVSSERVEQARAMADALERMGKAVEVRVDQALTGGQAALAAGEGGSAWVGLGEVLDRLVDEVLYGDGA